MTTRQLFTLLLLLLVAGLFVVLNQQAYVPGDNLTERGGFDAFAEDLTLSIMNMDGQPAYRMTATSMTHHDGTDVLVLSQPRLDITRPDGSAWHITAPRGEAAGNGENVWLPGEVELNRAAGDKLAPMQIKTRDVRVRPHERLADTDSEALIITRNLRIETVGLKADFNNNRLELKSRVRGRHHGAS